MKKIKSYLLYTEKGFADTVSSLLHRIDCSMEIIREEKPDDFMRDFDVEEDTETYIWSDRYFFGFNPMETVERIRSICPKVMIYFLMNGTCPTEYAYRLKNMKIDGVLENMEDEKAMQLEVTKILYGRRNCYPERIRRGLEHMEHKYNKYCSVNVTKIECDILKMTSFGQTMDEIGCMMNVTKATVNTHLSRLKKKIGARNTPEAVRIAMRYRAVCQRT